MNGLHCASTNSDPEPRLLSRSTADEVPLTFIQEWWWKEARLRRPAGYTHVYERRCCASVRILGRLNIQFLRTAFNEVVRRHESLRIHLEIVDSTLRQNIREPSDYTLELIELTQPPGPDNEAEARRLLEEVVYEPTEAVFGARLVKLGNDDHALIVAMPHIIADGVSVGILFRDIWTSYAQALRAQPLALPKIAVQYGDYAVWLRKTQPWWLRTHGQHWKERLEGVRHVPFQGDEGIACAEHHEIVVFPIQLGQSLSARLREVSRAERTTLNLTILAAYIATILRWQDRRDWVVGVWVNGRDRPMLENVVGFFATVLYLRIQLSETDTFSDLLRTVATEYRLACQHNDAGRLSVAPIGSDLERVAFFNWVPMQASSGVMPPVWPMGETDPAKVLKFEPFRISHRNVDFEGTRFSPDPRITLADSANGVSGAFCYRSNLFKPATVEGFSRNFARFLQKFADDQRARITTISYDPPERASGDSTTPTSPRKGD